MSDPIHVRRPEEDEKQSGESRGAHAMLVYFASRLSKPSPARLRGFHVDSSDRLQERFTRASREAGGSDLGQEWMFPGTESLSAMIVHLRIF
jgi:hypothetical protein